MNKLPDFISKEIKKIKNPTKIFKDIGLEDRRLKLTVNQNKLIENCKKELKHYLTEYFENGHDCYDNDEIFIKYDIKKNLYMKIDSKNIDKLLNFKIVKNKFVPSLVLNKLLEHNAKEDKIWWLNETIQTFKTLLKSNLKIVFSTDQYDLATISMRGINSCMKWSSGQAKGALIGTVIDPFCGVLYITDDTKTKYGEKMLYRVLVRLVINNDNVSLFLEPIYHHSGYPSNRPDYDCDDYYHDVDAYDSDQNAMLMSVFTKYLEMHCSENLNIISGGDDYYTIPSSHYLDVDLDKKFGSYSDFDLEYDDFIPKLKNVKLANLIKKYAPKDNELPIIDR